MDDFAALILPCLLPIVQEDGARAQAGCGNFSRGQCLFKIPAMCQVSSVELERVCVEGVPSVLEAAAVGVPAPGGGPEQLVLFLVPRAQQGGGSRREDADAVRARCQAAIRARLNPLFKVERVSACTLPNQAAVEVSIRAHLACWREGWFLHKQDVYPDITGTQVARSVTTRAWMGLVCCTTSLLSALVYAGAVA